MQPFSVESETPQQPWDEDDHEHENEERRGGAKPATVSRVTPTSNPALTRVGRSGSRRGICIEPRRTKSAVAAHLLSVFLSVDYPILSELV
jgi:hypothetical protein